MLPKNTTLGFFFEQNACVSICDRFSVSTNYNCIVNSDIFCNFYSYVTDEDRFTITITIYDYDFRWVVFSRYFP